MIRLYDNPFSPFTRKVRMVLAHKGVAFESIDALALDHHADLVRANPRGEVPVLDDDGFLVVNSSEIVAYLEDRCPERSVLPADARARARARAWERFSDTVVDSIVHDISIWTWPTHRRTDAPPEGLVDAGRRDLHEIAARVEASLEGNAYLCGDAVSIADFALFPHLSSFKPLGVLLNEAQHPNTLLWNRRMRALDVVRNDLDYLKGMAFARFGSGPSPYEGVRVIWRGDRLEWLFANGFHAWWAEELCAGRAVVPSWRGRSEA